MLEQKPNEPSYATKYIKEHGHEPVSIFSTRENWVLSSSLVHNTKGAHIAAEMEDTYRSEANEFAEKGKFEEAEQVIVMGQANFERYLRDQRLQPRILAMIDIEDDLSELEQQRVAILNGDLSPFPPPLAAREGEIIVTLSEEASKLL